MKRELTEDEKRENTRKHLIKLLKQKGLTGQVYQDKIQEYLTFYDAFLSLNQAINDLKSEEKEEKKGGTKDMVNALGEMRRVSEAMRNIITFLGLKPEPESGGGPPEKL